MLRFRALRETDYSQWHKLWEHYLVFYQTSLAEEITQTAWQRIVRDEIHSIGVFNENELIAFMHFHTQINTWKIGKVYYLEDLFVSSSHRGKGIATQLIHYLYDLARRNKYERVYWITTEDNLAAQELYDKLAQKTDFIFYKQEF